MRCRSPLVVLALFATTDIAGCTTDPPSADVLAQREPDPAAREATATSPLNRPRMMRDRCHFTTRSTDSLDAALAGFNVLEQWPILATITWTAAADEWIGLQPSHPRQAQLSVNLLEASAADIVVHSPAAGAPSICQLWVEFDAEVDVRTRDGVVDTRAHGRFVARGPTTTGKLRVDMQPATASSLANATRSIGLVLELPRVLDQLTKAEIIGFETRTGVGPGGRGFVSGGPTVLGSNAPL